MNLRVKRITHLYRLISRYCPKDWLHKDVKMNSLKTKIKNMDITIGSWINMSHLSIAEIMVQSGFDWLTIDIEHSAITMDQVQQLIQVIDLGGCIPLVRVSANDANIIKRVMDAGSHGVIVPMVNSKEDAARAVGAVKYPPKGFRGVGLSRAQSYGADFEGYMKWNEEESIVIVQIESIEAVANLESILSVDGVDAFIVGPYDISSSLGIAGQFDNPKMLEVLSEIQDVARRLNKVSGYHVVPPKPDLVVEKIEQGYRFIAYSVDFLLLGETCRQGLKAIRQNIGK